jgi:peptidoglycan/LPS O-acetylase OafA/YrhL
MSEAVLNLSRWFFGFSIFSRSQSQTVVQSLPLVDWIKALAAQAVVLHHLALYGPMARVAADRYPTLVQLFYEYGLLAVQAFLVVGGFLAVRGLAPEGRLKASAPLQILWKRYQRLVLPFGVALIFAVLGSWLASLWLNDAALIELGSVKEMFRRFATHLVLLHSITETDSLSAGVWYVAIDFQLFALLLATLWVSERCHQLGTKFLPWSALLVFAAMTLSLLFFNRRPELDVWGIYFVGSYGLGVMSFWISKRKDYLMMLAVGVAALVALLVEFRLRIAVAVAVAMLLMLVSHQDNILLKLRSKLIGFLSKISYGTFLIHFPICLIANAIFDRLAHPNPSVALFGLLMTWMCAIAAGAMFERWVEQPLKIFERVSNA